MITEYRCNLTIDLEEAIKMNDQKKCKNAKIISTYKSGRKEEYVGKLKKDQTTDKKFNDHLSMLQKMDTIENIQIVKF